MAKFNAADALEPLEYDFQPYVAAKGTVPEPTDEQVADFYGNMGKQLEVALGAERVAGVDLTDPMQVGRLFMSLTVEDHRRMYDANLDLHSAVCGGQPSRDELAALPFRLRQAFYGMVQGWLRPEASKPATTD